MLDPALRPAALPAVPPDQVRQVLLTGATGFLGAFLLAELLRRGKQVCCLVRPGTGQTAAERLSAHLQRLGISATGQAGALRVLTGDLSQPQLGLSAADYAGLAAQIDVIYHAASYVNFVRSYDDLRASNVLGVRELLRLSAAQRGKPLHLVSTLALFFQSEGAPAEARPRAVSERDVPELPAGQTSGYLQSKWVAEELVRAAQERGLPATIYRTGRIAGHSQTGATANLHDLLNLIIAACSRLQVYPDWDIELNLAPVDYICQALIELSVNVKFTGKALHLFNQTPIAFGNLMRIIARNRYPLTLVSDLQFRQLVGDAARNSLAAGGLFSKLGILLRTKNHLFTPRPDYLTPDSQPFLREQGIVCPPIEDAWVARYMGYLHAQGLWD